MKNKISVFTLGMRPRYYLKHPWKLFHEIYWNFRNFFHRGRFGFGYCDVWCMDEYLLSVIPLMLRHLAEYSCGYPGTEPYETPEKYTMFLRRLAEKFENCREENIDRKNEYSKTFDEMIKNKRNYDELTDEEKELRNKYFNRAMEIQKERDEAIVRAYTELAENHNILWD